MTEHRGRVTVNADGDRPRTSRRISLLTGIVVIGLVVSLVLNGSLPLPSRSSPTRTTLIERPALPGESGGSPTPTFAGASARCRDGTYAYVGGATAEDTLCGANGGVEQLFGR